MGQRHTNRSARRAPGRAAPLIGLVARSPAMRAVVDQLSRFAATDANILITGETGAGKDAIAAAIHRLGGRASRPFVTVDCPGLPASLLESELFGHERGAFTDAAIARPGRFELAGRGTLYLDRVDELPLELQPKLLRLVEQKQVERLGGRVAIAVHARIVASANDGIERLVQDGSFRSDLYHRLRVLALRVPPLRERRADLLPLARKFLIAFARDTKRPTPTLSRAAIERLHRHDWPGNVRELRHTLERAVLSSPGDRIDADDLPIDIRTDAAAVIGTASAAVGASAHLERPTLEELERRYLAIVLADTKGNQTEAARILGISRKALWEKRRRYGFA